MTRLLLRRPGKIHPFASLCPTYSPELGEEGVKAAARALTLLLDIPGDITSSEMPYVPFVLSSTRTPLKPSISPLQPHQPYPTPSSEIKTKPRGKRKALKAKPWSDLPTGMSAMEEQADPELAEAIRESLWASKVGRVELDDDGGVIHTPPPERIMGSRSTSNTSATSSRSGDSSRGIQGSTALPLVQNVDAELVTLTPQSTPPITVFAKDNTEMSLSEIMTCVSAEDLRKVARSRKVPLSSLGNRSAVEAALRGLASKQTVLGFTPKSGRARNDDFVQRSNGQTILPVTPNRIITTESLIVASLMPYLGGAAIQLTSEMHALIARVNLIYSRTPPVTASSSSLMLPSILVASHKRRYPDYGPPTRSRIWSTRDELLTWERATHWESVVADALGDTWLEQWKNRQPGGYGMIKQPPNRIDGANIVKRIWEGVWPIWKELVEGKGAEEVDATLEEGGLVGDRFKTGQLELLRWSPTKLISSRTRLDSNRLQSTFYQDCF